MILKEKEKKNNDPNLTIFNYIKKIDISLEHIFNFDIVPQNVIAKRYFQLIRESIINGCFKNMFKAIYQDFDNNFVLVQLAKLIKQNTFCLIIKKQNCVFAYEELLQLKVLIHVFLSQIRYDANIWMHLKKKNCKKLQKKPSFHWNLAILLVDFDILEAIGLKFEKDQKQILKVIFTIQKEDNFIDIKNKLNLIENTYLPLRMFALEKEILKTVKNHKIRKKRFEQILYATLFQMIAIFIRQNLRKKIVN